MGLLVLVPWAETDWSASGRLAATTELPLNASGLSQAAEWGEVLANHGLRTVFASDELTSQQTAETIAHGCQAKVKTADGLEEVSLGLWEGLTAESLKSRFARVYKRWEEDPASVSVPEGEELSVAQERIGKAVTKVARKANGRAVGVVLGPMACGIARCLLEDVDLSDVRQVMSNEPVWYEYEPGGKAGLVKVGD